MLTASFELLIFVLGFFGSDYTYSEEEKSKLIVKTLM